MATVSHRHRRGGFPLGKVFAIVIAVHVIGGLGVTWLAKTTAGQELAKKYDIKLFAPPKPPEPEQAKQEPPPPPPPPKTKDVPPPPAAAESAPKIASAAPPSAPVIGGGGGGAPNWGGGKFLGAGLGDGPEGAFHAAVTGRFRKHYSEPPDAFGWAELEVTVGEKGEVRSFRLARSSGNPKNDQAILDAAARVQGEGVGVQPPENHARIVTVRFVPSS